MSFKFSIGRVLVTTILALVLLTTCQKKESDDTPRRYPDHIVAGRTVGADILYSGPLNIDIIFSGIPIAKEWDIDLNNDGTDDFLLTYSYRFGHGFEAISVELKSLDFEYNYVATKEDMGFWADTISVGEIINENLNWFAWIHDIYYFFQDVETNPCEKGLWKGIKNKYLGVKFKSGENQIYGWIAIETDGYNFEFLGYACTRGY